jgi:methionyl-tRNA synthetase
VSSTILIQYTLRAFAHILLAPHVGHLYTMVLSDILKRWQTLMGKKAILCTGTDENGMKVGVVTMPCSHWK